MLKLNRDIINFFEDQGCVLLATVDRGGYPHTSCKGLVKIEEPASVFLLDAYHSATFRNLKNNPSASVTAFNEHKFKGYCLKGKARVADTNELTPDILKAWEKKVSGRLTQRLLKNIREERGHKGHPEALLPKPKYMIIFKVGEIIDLAPAHLK